MCSGTVGFLQLPDRNAGPNGDNTANGRRVSSVRGGGHTGPSGSVEAGESGVSTGRPCRMQAGISTIDYTQNCPPDTGTVEDIFVARLVSSGRYTVSPDTLVEDAAYVVLEEDIGSIVVVELKEKYPHRHYYGTKSVSPVNPRFTTIAGRSMTTRGKIQACRGGIARTGELLFGTPV